MQELIHSLSQSAIEAFGQENQLRKAQEEAIELALAVTRFLGKLPAPKGAGFVPKNQA